MKHLSAILLTIACTSGLFAQTTNQVVISFNHKAGTEPLVLDQTVFSIWNGKKIKLSRAEFYISEMEIHQAGNVNTPLTDKYLLVNANNPAAEYDFGQWPVGDAQGVTLHLGVPQSANHGDPSSYPAGHPLAPQNPSMHWGWTAGYRFMAIEGKVDNNNDGIPETTLEFHNLGDALYTTIELTGAKEVENGVLHLQFDLDYAKLFHALDMTGNLIQHGSAPINGKMMTNADTQDFITMPLATATDDVNAHSANIKAVPNPANTETSIRYNLPASGSLNLVLTNLLGQTVRSLSGLPASGSARLETAGLPEGVYQYAIFENGNLLARKQMIICH